MVALALLAFAHASPSERLDRLIASANLDAAGLAALATTEPSLAWQLTDPASRAALDYVLALPAADIRTVRQGQTVIRTGGEGSDAEWAALWRLAEALGEKPRRVEQVRVRTVDAQLVRIDLELRRETHGIDIAWPAASAPPRVALDVARDLGVATDPPAPLQDGSFEVAWSAGFAWMEAGPAGTAVTRDTARVAAGASSLRLESHTRALPVVTQTIVAAPGDRLVLTGQAAPDGADPVVALVFRDASGEVTREVAELREGAGGWAPVFLDATTPPDAVEAWVELTLSGPGAANVDDLALRTQGAAPSALATWFVAETPALVVHADPARCGGAAPALASAACAVDAAARLRPALDAGLGRVSVGAQGVVNVWVFADAAHRAALAPRAPGGPRAFGDDVEGGTCYILAESPWAAACPVGVMLTRAWGPAGNSVMASGLPRALAGSGTDLHAAARPTLASTAPVAELGRGPGGGPAREAAVTSFAAWLLDTQSLAAVRAAWQADTLATYTVAGQDIAALDAAWRAAVGK
jgi:hypothetical protein